MINGGNAAKGMLGGEKFNAGDKVISKSAPDEGVGFSLITESIKSGDLISPVSPLQLRITQSIIKEEDE